jgi:hypothetical protein
MNAPVRVTAFLGEWAEYPSSPADEERFQRLAERDERIRLEKDFEDLKSMGHKAASGVYGKAAQDLARSFLAENAQSRPNLEVLRKLLRKVPGRMSG